MAIRHAMFTTSIAARPGGFASGRSSFLVIVTSTLPPGKSAADDFAAQLDRERDTEAKVRRVAAIEQPGRAAAATSFLYRFSSPILSKAASTALACATKSSGQCARNVSRLPIPMNQEVECAEMRVLVDICCEIYSRICWGSVTTVNRYWRTADWCKSAHQCRHYDAGQRLCGEPNSLPALKAWKVESTGQT